MSQHWYALIGGAIHGPMDSQRLKLLADKGKLMPTDQVAPGESGHWVLASQVLGLLDGDLASSKGHLYDLMGVRLGQSGAGPSKGQSSSSPGTMAPVQPHRGAASGGPSSASPSPTAPAQSHVAPAQSLAGASNDFPALRTIARIYKFIANVALLLGVVAIVVSLVAALGNLAPFSVIAFVVAVVWTAFVPLLLWGVAELILVFLSIERNTRRTHELLRQSISPPGGP